MRISSTYFTNNFLSEVNNLQNQQNTLQTEAATGLKVTEPEDDPAVMSDVLNLQTASNANNQYEDNITSLQSQATTAGSAMNSLQTIVNQVSTYAEQASNGANVAQLPVYAADVKNLIQEALQIGNTQDANGNYIFGGTKSNTPPFVATTDSSGNITAVAYQGNSSVPSSEIAPNTTVSAQVPGANTTGSGVPGLFTDSASGADLFNHMIALQQDITSGNTAAITSTDMPALGKDENNVINAISANGVLQSTLTNATNIATAQGTNITTQISGDTNADLATVLTQLTQTQTAYQAALASGAQVFNMSLLNYLQ